MGSNEMDIKAPEFPESIADGELTKWYKQEGDYVERDEVLADVETEKTTIEIVALAAGVITKIMKQEGDIVESEELLCSIDDSSTAPTVEAGDDGTETSEEWESIHIKASPAARKLASEHAMNLLHINGSGRGGTITKQDVSLAIENNNQEVPELDRDLEQVHTDVEPASEDDQIQVGERQERRVPMTRLRATIASRLVEVQQTTAMLTTFNEANMEPIRRMRQQYREEFERRHNGTRLGFMSFFVRASVESLKRFPSVNASIDGTDVIYHGYYDVGVAVSTERGLVVPIIRNADALALHQIEDQITDFSDKARNNKLAIEDMTGGTFTISNGGVFGSLMSTPILNPPQTAILGMHTIQERPVVEDGEIVIRPMMYLALSYDHRMIDGQEAVQFLSTIKSMLEDPARILLEL